ncbi:hypothetical protein GKC29_01255 [Micromonospora sp. WMMC415]|uniref:hypothetical protein n=1 Tax=Micromonospora sp. WMMC415 TaxID=2675222 RepID=UPI0012B477A9|nr:hypothetical protein [Micromonospora sp. WMMC415]QGN45621.1 hypothetical protein GKC29_01255 [Micromonospora sp. WMMC415]
MATLAPVLLFLSLFSLSGFLGLLLWPAIGWAGVVIPILLVVLGLTSWRIKHRDWRGRPDPQSARQLMLGGSMGLIL